MLLCCLKCTSVLDKTRVEDIEVDTCPSCGGLWLDHGEIEKIVKKIPSEIDRLRKLLAPHKNQPPPVANDDASTCPSCTSPMKEAPLGPITIDYCTRCKGFFLDRGEIDAALEAVKGGTTIVQLIATAADAIPAG
jgi:Zn-finger nucleic acid-binding protein